VNIRIADPLPECSLCGTPTKRAKHERNGGLCSRCASGVADTVRMLPAGGVVDLDRERARRRASEALDQTVFVERYRPPVPGQLTTDDLVDLGPVEP
jgi:recombinational DNA repair protein (RecF pathway)